MKNNLVRSLVLVLAGLGLQNCVVVGPRGGVGYNYGTYTVPRYVGYQQRVNFGVGRYANPGGTPLVISGGVNGGPVVLNPGQGVAIGGPPYHTITGTETTPYAGFVERWNADPCSGYGIDRLATQQCQAHGYR